MSSLLLVSVLSNAIVIFMLWLFLTTGLSKLKPSNHYFYVDVLSEYGIKLPDLASVLVWLLGSLEVLGAVLVVLPASRFIGAILCTALLVMYLFVLSHKIRQGKLDMDCGCAGPASGIKVSPMLLLRNVLLIALLVFFPLSNEILTGVISQLDMSSWILSFGMAGMLVFIYQSTEHLLANHQKLALLQQHN